MLDLLEPGEDEILELLAPLLVEEGVSPPEEGLLALHAALDRTFGVETHKVVPLVPRHRAVVRVLTGVAAAVVVLAVGLAFYGLQQAPRPPRAPTKLDYATSALRRDLQNGNSPTRVKNDITNLAHAMSAPPVSGGTTTAAPRQLLVSACRWLEGSSEGSVSLPPACQTGSGSEAVNSPTAATGVSSNVGGEPGFGPNPDSLDPAHQGSNDPGPTRFR